MNFLNSLEEPDYIHRVYAGVLGKIIGVYAGRPFEGWSYEKLRDRFGEVTYYVNEQLGAPLVVTDDDITGTFTFLRALEDANYDPDLTAEQMSAAWLNFIVENKAILWWGGRGVSTEHTAFLNLRDGVPAPQSGSIAQNGRVIAEQIGAQIFIDGWGLICPGDMEKAANFARRAASVSHDGEAIYGAQVVAALVAGAFVERDWNSLIDGALLQIPDDCIIARLWRDVRNWHTKSDDWHATRAQISQHWGYDKWGGYCHMVPNHAVIAMALLHGNGDFSQSLCIANSAGWDTDCNAANVGCILGVYAGLEGIESGPDWRGPVADRIFLPTVDGGRAISDAARESVCIINVARQLRGKEPWQPKDGARFHFALPGSLQGFTSHNEGATSLLQLENHTGALRLHIKGLTRGLKARATTPTFIPPSARDMGGYELLASPQMFPGQTVRALIRGGEGHLENARFGLFARSYGEGDVINEWRGERVAYQDGVSQTLEWTLPETGGAPFFEIGIEVQNDTLRAVRGALDVEWLTWEGVPDTVLGQVEGCKMASRAWVAAHTGDLWLANAQWPFIVSANSGVGLHLCGEASWNTLRVETTMRASLAEEWGIAVNVRGLRRFQAFVLGRDQKASWIEQWDDERRILAEIPFATDFDSNTPIQVEARSDGQLRAWCEEILLEAEIETTRAHGAIGLLCKHGTAHFAAVKLSQAGQIHSASNS